nr:Maff2 family protein [Clostridium fessum]
MKFAATSPEDQLPPEMAVFFMAGALPRRNGGLMQFFASAVTTLQTLVVALGAGLAVWGVVNLLEGYGSDNAAANAHVR